MPLADFSKRFIEFCELNRQRREGELRGETSLDAGVTSGWQKALDLLAQIYPQTHHRELLRKGLADPYFPVSMLRKVNVEEFAREPAFADLAEERLARIAAEHLLNWAEIFGHIRQDLASFNTYSRVSSLVLEGSPRESLPESSECNYCGGCCEIRGGPPEFTGGFEPPEQWSVYFRGDGCVHQRFCPFLFEYFATGKYFCSIYRVKPECCWAFDREECEFLQSDVARERQVNTKVMTAP
jgi:hypothetical protein